MSASITDYFDGRVEQTEYLQPIAKDGMGRWTGVFESQTFTFTGVPTSLADECGSVTVTDIGGAQYTFTLKQSYEDSSEGSAFFNKEECRVTRQRVGYHTWNITFTRIGGKLLLNGEKYKDGPSWMRDYNA